MEVFEKLCNLVNGTIFSTPLTEEYFQLDAVILTFIFFFTFQYDRCAVT